MDILFLILPILAVVAITVIVLKSMDQECNPETQEHNPETRILYLVKR